MTRTGETAESPTATSTRTRESYDAVAPRYAAQIGDELRTKPLDRALLDAFAELCAAQCPSPVLDVGAGPGHVAAYLRDRGARTVAVDLSPAMCSQARTRDVPACACDMTALPVRDGSVAGVVCLYAVIHLDARGRAAAYAELARVLRPGGYALVAFHTRDADIEPGGTRRLREWWGSPVDLTFGFLDPGAESAAVRAPGLDLVARLDRVSDPQVEHPSERTYLLARRPPA